MWVPATQSLGKNDLSVKLHNVWDPLTKLLDPESEHKRDPFHYTTEERL